MCNYDNYDNYDNYSEVSPASTRPARQNNFNVRASFNQNDFCNAVDTCNRRSNVAGVSTNYDNNYGNVAGVQEHHHHHHHRHDHNRCCCRRRRCCCFGLFW